MTSLLTSPPLDNGVLVLACGNPLRGDDGIGWQIAFLLEADPPCNHLQVIFTPQLLPEHAESVSAADRLIFFDCSATSAPGTVSITPIIPAARLPNLYTHHLDPAALLRLSLDLYGHAPSTAALITVGGASFDLNEQLTPAVAAAIPTALDAVRLCCRESVTA